LSVSTDFTIDNLSADLPDWMRRARRGTDWGALLVLAFSLLAAWSFLIEPGLPRTTAIENYIFRTADTAAALSEGRLYPRWSPNALLGYGAPIPHFYPPGATYPPALLQFFVVGDPTTAVRLYIAALFALAGSAVYTLTARRAGAAAGLLAALLYIYSPYFGLIAPHLLGDLPGFVGLALIPVLLWAVDRLLLTYRPLDPLLVALALAALVLTDVPSAGIGLTLAMILTVWHTVMVDHGARWSVVVLAMLFGVGVGACFWLPAILETEGVIWTQPLGTLPTLNYRDLFAPLSPLDPAALLPAAPLTLGLPALAAGAMAAAALIRSVVGTPRPPTFLFAPPMKPDPVGTQRAMSPQPTNGRGSSRKFHAFFLALALGIFIGAPTLLPTQPGLLGTAALCLALGSGAALEWRTVLPVRWRRISLPAAIALLLVGSVGVWLPPTGQESTIDTSPLAQLTYELNGYGIASLPAHLPIPSTIADGLPPNAGLIGGYRAGSINKIAQDQVGGEMQLGLLNHSTHSDRFQLQLYAARTLPVLTASFPGWMASINGFPQELTRDPVSGLMNLDLSTPASGELVISLESTPLRTAAWVVTWLALAGAVLTSALRLRNRDGGNDYRTLTLPEARLILTVLACFAAVVLFAAPGGLLRARPGAALESAVPFRATTDTGLEMLALRFERTEYRVGETLHWTQYWQTLSPQNETLRVRVALLSRQTGARWLATSPAHPGGYPVTRWPTDRYIADPYTLPLTNLPPGEYSPAVEVVRCMPDCAEALPFFDADGAPFGNLLVLPVTLVISQ
jgi:hypothetical protein